MIALRFPCPDAVLVKLTRVTAGIVAVVIVTALFVAFTVPVPMQISGTLTSSPSHEVSSGFNLPRSTTVNLKWATGNGSSVQVEVDWHVQGTGSTVACHRVVASSGSCSFLSEGGTYYFLCDDVQPTLFPISVTYTADFQGPLL